MTPYRFIKSARRPRALMAVVLWWAALLVLYLLFNAASLIILVLACASLPALYDIGANASAELQIDSTEISWRSGRRRASLPRGQLKLVRLDTRLDFSLRMTLHTYQGGKIRLPYECVPSANAIEDALKTYDIVFERHHFQLMS